MDNDANGTRSKIGGTVSGAKRNNLQKTLTDYDLYALYYKNPQVLLDKQMQCLEPRDYSAAETCDCLAGFPGDTLIGPGAGELVTGSNYAAAIKACGDASTDASNPALKARYLAQRARAQVQTMDPAQAVTWANEAIAAGYRRAAIVKAEAFLWGIEFRAGGFPPMTETQFREEMKFGLDNLQAAKKAGVQEAYLVATKYHQLLAHVAFNSAVMAPIVNSMMAEPQQHACGADTLDSYGNPIAGSGCGQGNPK